MKFLRLLFFFRGRPLTANTNSEEQKNPFCRKREFAVPDEAKGIDLALTCARVGQLMEDVKRAER
jgi:hypothetical protein